LDAIIALLLDGTGLALWSFALLCGVSFLGSFIAAALGLGGGALVLATMALFLPPAVLIPPWCSRPWRCSCRRRC
jgi:hypothetical protein